MLMALAGTPSRSSVFTTLVPRRSETSRLPVATRASLLACAKTRITPPLRLYMRATSCSTARSAPPSADEPAPNWMTAIWIGPETGLNGNVVAPDVAVAGLAICCGGGSAAGGAEGGTPARCMGVAGDVGGGGGTTAGGGGGGAGVRFGGVAGGGGAAAGAGGGTRGRGAPGRPVPPAARGG